MDPQLVNIAVDSYQFSDGISSIDYNIGKHIRKWQTRTRWKTWMLMKGLKT